MREIKVGRRRLKATPVFDTYWKFAAERQQVFMKRVHGEPAPWTDDPIISQHRFTNVYRASDRVSQYLIKHVIYGGPQTPEDSFFRTLLFKIFNRVETWEELEQTVGNIAWAEFDLERYARALDQLRKQQTVYSAAYIMPSPDFGFATKHRNHLRLLEFMMQDFAPDKLRNAKTLKRVYEILLSYRSLGPFLAFQFTIDLNYGTLIDFSEMDFVVAGPGARSGIRKCFADIDGLTDEEVIAIVTERAPQEFERLGLDFQTLWGRPPQLIDCQNLFCEVDKYARVAHPQVSGGTKRTKIKQKYTRSQGEVPQWYPPKWNIEIPSIPADDEQRMSESQHLLGL